MRVKVIAWLECEPLRKDESVGVAVIASCNAVNVTVAGADDRDARENLRAKIAERVARSLGARIVDVSFEEPGR